MSIEIESEIEKWQIEAAERMSELMRCLKEKTQFEKWYHEALHAAQIMQEDNTKLKIDLAEARMLIASCKTSLDKINKLVAQL